MSRCAPRVGPRVSALMTVFAFVLLCTPWLTPALSRAGKTPEFVQVTIDEVTPQTVTTGADPTVTVRGTVRNIGDRPVSDVMVRLERADPIATTSELRSNLHGHYDQYSPVSEFTTLADTLAQGQNRTFSLTLPLRGNDAHAWNIDKPGIYPALVNVNGTPDYGVAARLDDARFLLPVLGVPPLPAAPSSELPPDSSSPASLTLMWPLADRPRLVPGQPGGPTPVRLVDDELAKSFSSGGRLDILLGAVTFATTTAIDPHGDLGRALCLAVDPDLLVTANAMSYGYQVLDDPANPFGPSHPGTGQAAASAWMDRLRTLAKHTCVAPLPYAQADLNAVARIDDPGLTQISTLGASDVVDQILGVASIRDVTLLPDGALTHTTEQMLSQQGPTVAISAAPLHGKDQPDLTPRRVSDTVVAAPFDTAVGAALSAVGNEPVTPDYVPESLRFGLEDDSRSARLQDALAALALPAVLPQETARQQILMPDPSWDLSDSEARALLSTTATLLHSGLALPRPLPTVIGEARAGTMASPIDSSFSTSSSADSGSSVADADWLCQDLGDQVRRLWALTAALTVDPRTGLTGTEYTEPLREDTLRGLSQSLPPASRDDAAIVHLDALRRAVTDLSNAVTVVNPGGSYTLATEHSPLPLVLRNELPLPIKVGIHLDMPAGMKAGDLGVQEIPPGFLPVKVPVEVSVSQRTAVDVYLRTPDGLPLGEPVRLSVHSNAYGKLLFIITVSAATVLFALTGRRLWHRFQGQPDRADLDRDER